MPEAPDVGLTPNCLTPNCLTPNCLTPKAHRFARTCARCCLKRTGALLLEGETPSVDVVGEVVDEALWL
ncbi:MAG: hypothetical protein M0005_14565, partial [Actinomycetota bacterium]|nr:hypothetical protein [Actinomycetota bacterium]